MTHRLSADQPIELTVEARAHGWRVDHYLTRLFPNYSRALLQKAIGENAVLVNGLPVKASRRLRVNDRLSVRLPEQPDSSVPPENIPLDVLYEDEALVVLNKPPGMIVHPGKGNYRGTLAGALQFHFDQLSDMAGQYRPGIVHRLDRDTSGVLVVAKNNQVHHRLSRQFERRDVKKEYRAIVCGNVVLDSDYVETHVRVNPRQREKMQVCAPDGKARKAITFYEVLERFDGFTYVRLIPETGRTHQLRVHMMHLGHPIVADRLYGGRPVVRGSPDPAPPSPCEPGGLTPRLAGGEGLSEVKTDADPLITRQALHAYRLQLKHPESGQPVSFEAPLPEDFQRTLAVLRNTNR